MLCLFNNLFFYLYRIQLYSYLYLTNNEQYFNISRRFLYTIAYSYSPGTHSQSSARVRSPLTVCAVAQYSFCSILARHSARVRSPLAVWLSPDKKIKPYTFLKVNFHRVMAHFFAWLVANTQICTPCPK